MSYNATATQLIFTIDESMIQRQAKMYTQIRSKISENPDLVALTDSESDVVETLLLDGANEILSNISDQVIDIPTPIVLNAGSLVITITKKDGFNQTLYPVWENLLVRGIVQYVLKEWYRMINHEGGNSYLEVKQLIEVSLKIRKKPA